MRLRLFRKAVPLFFGLLLVAGGAAAAEAGQAPAVEFSVVSVTKDHSHPQHSSGSKVGFAVDGVQGRTLVLVRGKTYRFNVDTGVQHDFYLSTDPAGWGSGTLTEGVEGNYTYRGVVTFTPTAATPDIVYYQCRNHKYMGGIIHIVNPGEEDKIKIAAPPPAPAVAREPPPPDRNEVKERLSFAELFITKSEAAKRIAASKNDSARAEHQDAQGKLAAAKSAFDGNRLREAKASVDAAMLLMSSATRRVPSEAMLVKARERYQELLRGLQTLIASHERNYESIAREGGVKDLRKLDRERLDKAVASARTLHDEGSIDKANEVLSAAQSDVSDALNRMLNSRTMSYRVEFTSQADEYAYELSRFAHYEELIPPAIEQTRPSPETVARMRIQETGARAKRDLAVAAAKGQDYAAAIEHLRSGIAQLDLAIKMLGVR